MTRLLHVSEEPGITRFLPRPAPPGSGHEGVPLVWAIDDAHLHLYLVPRQCPRVVMDVGPDTTDLDRSRFLGPDDGPVVVIEDRWLEPARTTTLWVYQLPAAAFELLDPNAGYHVAREPVGVAAVRRVDAPLDELARRGVQLRTTDDLRGLAGEVARSTLTFSIIRLRNAAASSRTVDEHDDAG